MHFDAEMATNGIVIFGLALLFGGIGVEWYFYRKCRHIKQVIDLAKED